MKKARRAGVTTGAQLLMFAPGATAGLPREEARQLANAQSLAQWQAQLDRKFGPGWEHRSDRENEVIAERLERKRQPW